MKSEFEPFGYHLIFVLANPSYFFLLEKRNRKHLDIVEYFKSE